MIWNKFFFYFFRLAPVRATLLALDRVSEGRSCCSNPRRKTACSMPRWWGKTKPPPSSSAHSSGRRTGRHNGRSRRWNRCHATRLGRNCLTCSVEKLATRRLRRQLRLGMKCSGIQVRSCSASNGRRKSARTTLARWPNMFQTYASEPTSNPLRSRIRSCPNSSRR